MESYSPKKEIASHLSYDVNKEVIRLFAQLHDAQSIAMGSKLNASITMDWFSLVGTFYNFTHVMLWATLSENAPQNMKSLKTQIEDRMEAGMKLQLKMQETEMATREEIIGLNMICFKIINMFTTQCQNLSYLFRVNTIEARGMEAALDRFYNDDRWIKKEVEETHEPIEAVL